MDLIDIEETKRAHGLSDVHYVHADSIQEAIEIGNDDSKVHECMRSRGGSTRSSHSRNDDKDGWHGSPSWNYMQAIVDNGWTKGRLKLSAGLRDIYRAESSRFGDCNSREYDIAGSLPDVPLAAAGDLFCMYDDGDRMISQRPVLRLIVESVASASVDPSFIMNRGSAVASLVDEIETSGVSCELVTVFSSMNSYSIESSERLLFLATTVKHAGEIADIDDVAFGLGHPSMMRRVMFGLLETCDWEHLPEYVGGYGHPFKEEVLEGLPNDTIYLAGLNRDPQSYRTPEGAMRHVRQLYNNQCGLKGWDVVDV